MEYDCKKKEALHDVDVFMGYALEPDESEAWFLDTENGLMYDVYYFCESGMPEFHEVLYSYTTILEAEKAYTYNATAFFDYIYENSIKEWVTELDSIKAAKDAVNALTGGSGYRDNLLFLQRESADVIKKFMIQQAHKWKKNL